MTAPAREPVRSGCPIRAVAFPLVAGSAVRGFVAERSFNSFVIHRITVGVVLVGLLTSRSIAP